MKKVILIIIGFTLLSCQKSDRVERFSKEKNKLENTIKYIQSNYSLLLSSKCIGKSGIIISDVSVNDKNCYPLLKKNLQEILQSHICSINVLEKNNILFELNFTSNDLLMKEITQYYLYYEGEELPQEYQDWIGEKEKLTTNWWYIEYTNSQW